MRASSNASKPDSYADSLAALGRLGPRTQPISSRAIPIPTATIRNSRVGKYSASTLLFSRLPAAPRPLLGRLGAGSPVRKRRAAKKNGSGATGPVRQLYLIMNWRVNDAKTAKPFKKSPAKAGPLPRNATRSGLVIGAQEGTRTPTTLVATTSR